MKVNKSKALLPAVVVAVAISGGAAYLGSSNYVIKSVSAYTSALNNQDPLTARDDYVITFPDVNLKRALNPVIAKAHNAARKQQGLPEDVVRTADQDITAGDMKYPANMYGPLGLNGKNISNVEGLQFLVNATRLDIVGNQITDFSPLRDLPKLGELNMGNNPATDLTPIATISNLTKLTLDRSPNLISVAPLATAPKLKVLHLSITKVADLSPLAQISTLEELYINNMTTRPKINITPLAAAPRLNLINANGNRLTGADFAALKTAPSLETLMTAGNNVLNLNDMLKDGFAPLQRWSTFSDQVHDINVGTNPIFENPVRGVDGEIIPVNETNNIKNVDPDGSLNPNGTHIKLVNLYGRGNVGVRWGKNFTKEQVTDRPFSGTITVTYNLPAQDTVKPTFSPEQPIKIVSRKGTALNLNDVTAQDNQGGSGIASAGVTHNAAAINLDPNSPAKGNYELTYSVSDNAGNTATVKRSIEITDADALQQKVDSVGGNFLDGYTLDTKNDVVAAQRHAEGIIRENASTQDQIDEALRDLDRAIKALRANRRAIEQATTQYNREPQYVQHDPAVSAALQQANNIYNLPAPGPTPAQVKQAADNLNQAMENAKQAEADRQTAARQAFDKAEQDKTASAIADAKNKIAAPKDEGTRHSMERELAPIERDYNNAKKALEDIIARAEDPKTTENASDATKQTLADQVRLAKALFNSDPSQTDLENMKNDVEQKINELRPDTAALEVVINSVSSESAFVQQDAEVIKKLAAANDIKNNPAATIQQIATAKAELEKAISDARATEAEQRAEEKRQQDAQDAVENAETVKTPESFKDAQAKIDLIKDEDKKQELQDRLNEAKTNYEAKKEELRKLLEQVNNDSILDGMTEDTARALRAERKSAKAIYDQANIDQGSIDDAIADLSTAIANLKTDKKPVEDAIAKYNAQPDYIKNNTAVANAFRNAGNVQSVPNPSVQSVKNTAKELNDAIDALAKKESEVQTGSENALKKAEEILEAFNPAENTELPAEIKVDEIQALVDQIKDSTKKEEYQKALDELKVKLADAKTKLKQTENAKPEEGKQKQENTGTSKAETKADKPAAPSTGVQREENNNAAPVAIFGGVIASLTAAFAAFKSKKEKSNK